MEIRIANINRGILERVREDAKKNMRTIGKQALFIIQDYYDRKDAQDVSPQPAREKLVVTYDGKKGGDSHDDSQAWRFDEDKPE